MRGFLIHCCKVLTAAAWSALALTGCLSFNASLQSARVLEPEASSQTLAGHLVEEVESDLVKKRPFIDLAREFDPNTQLPFFGMSYHYRHGWQEGSDYGLSLSMGLSGVDIKQQLYSGDDLALAGGVKVLAPTLSLLYFESYLVGVPLYASYDLLDGLSIYCNPAFYIGAARSHNEHFVELSTGLIMGQKAGAVIEWSFVSDPDSLSNFDRYRQFKVGYFWQSDEEVAGEKAAEPLPIFPELGFSVAPLPSFGLLKRWDLDRSLAIEIGGSFGFSTLASTYGEIKRNFARSNLSTLQLRWLPQGRYSLYAGLARREVGSTLETDVGWQRIDALTYGVTLGFGQAFSKSEIDWLGVYFPLDFLPRMHDWSPLTEGIAAQTPSVGRMLENYLHGPSIQLFRYRTLF